MIPVVFIHKGNSSYIYNTLYQLKQTNPQAPVYFIGTDESHVYEPIVEHISIDVLSEEANQFAELYKHYSTNSEAFELMCIQRWFVLKSFMIQKGIERCLYLDSDVLVYDDVQHLSDTYKHAGMTLCGISGHTNFVNKDVLMDFCTFVIDSYTGADALNALEKYYKDFVSIHGVGGVSDMTLLTAYAEKNKQKVENTYCFNGASSFDPSLEVGKEYFEMDKGIKKIFFQKGKPFGILKLNQKAVLFHTLHFQGAKAKKFMVKYMPFKSFSFWVGYMKYLGIYFFQKVKKKLMNKQHTPIG
ncbi:hypothetical protein [Flavobacterium sp.]|uniref:hypothetical protein n=1 Tax=Flavobacterium sp. TaxID=239 RepID=UPI0025C0BB25|nr:hypothetical protein [Flavobacterium sp.]